MYGYLGILQDVTEKGWALCQTSRFEGFEAGEIYPCLILLPERNFILIPELSTHPFTNGLAFKILDTYLINIKKVLE